MTTEADALDAYKYLSIVFDRARHEALAAAAFRALRRWRMSPTHREAARLVCKAQSKPSPEQWSALVKAADLIRHPHREP